METQNASGRSILDSTTTEICYMTTPLGCRFSKRNVQPNMEEPSERTTMSNVFSKWGSLVLLFMLMAFMGSTLWVSTVIPAHNAKRLEDIQETLNERSTRFDRLESELKTVENLQIEHHRAIKELHKNHKP